MPPQSSESVPSATILPSMMMPTLSQSFSTSEKICVERMMLLPIALSSSKKSVTTFAVSTSSPLVGSSKMTTSGSCTMAMTSETFCFMPVERSFTLTSANLSMPKRANSSFLRAASFALSMPCIAPKKSKR